MIEAIVQWKDRLFGSGRASTTIPVLDGPLKSNNLLEEAFIFATLSHPEDLATDGEALYVANGTTVLRYAIAHVGEVVGAQPMEVIRFERRVSALCCIPGGGLAVSLGGTEVRVVGGKYDGRRWETVANSPLSAVNAISSSSDGRLIVTDGSTSYSVDNWKYDLMTLGGTGRVVSIDLNSDVTQVLASGMAFAFGACAVGNAIWMSESWKHQVTALGVSGVSAVTDPLPAYPSRITAASPQEGGGYWLTCFTLRTQLVEFVLREPLYRKRMVQEIDPHFWIAPALNSGNTFLEPMQGAQLKMMGVVKPWAPPHSYGLVIRLSPEGQIRYSLHSRFDGLNHGVVSAVECGEHLYVLAKGRGRVLRVSLETIQSSLQL